jgi:hypothetical protein
MKRRTFLKLGAASAAGATARPVLAHYQSANPPASLDDLGGTVVRLRNQFLASFDASYVDRVIFRISW